MEKLNLFFSKIKELTFWQRLFNWRSVRSLSYDAFQEYNELRNSDHEKARLLENYRNEMTRQKSEIGSLSNQVKDSEKLLLKKDTKIDTLNNKVSELSKSLSDFESNEANRKRDYERNIAEVNQLKNDLETDRKRFHDQKEQERQAEFDRMKKQWSEHQDEVENTIKMLCRQHLIRYVDEVPFKGNPDNTLEICDEFIIFDAKSPANNDLSNFPNYIKNQAEAAQKYAAHDAVKKDMYLVVPTNTIGVITRTVFKMADYNVYVITKDSLEPIILSLKKIEEYEFAEQLSPEDRDQVCRILGKYVHTTKRKIQIDQFMNGEMLNLIFKTETSIPEAFLKSVNEYELAEKLNPPVERRRKEIRAKELQRRHDLIDAESKQRGIQSDEEVELIKQIT